MNAAKAIGVPLQSHGHALWQKNDRTSAHLLSVSVTISHTRCFWSSLRGRFVSVVIGEAVRWYDVLHPQTIFESCWAVGFQMNELCLFSAEKLRAGHCGMYDIAQALGWAQIPIRLHCQVRMG